MEKHEVKKPCRAPWMRRSGRRVRIELEKSVLPISLEEIRSGNTEWVPVDRLATMLNVCKGTVYYRIETGKLQARTFEGRILVATDGLEPTKKKTSEEASHEKRKRSPAD